MRRSRAVPSRTQIEVETFVPLIFTRLQTRQLVRQTGVADEYVELAETTFNFGEKSLDILAPDDINVDGEGAFAALAGDRVRVFVVDVGDENVRAFLCEKLCGRAPDAAPRAGHDRDFVC